MGLQVTGNSANEMTCLTGTMALLPGPAPWASHSPSNIQPYDIHIQPPPMLLFRAFTLAGPPAGEPLPCTVYPATTYPCVSLRNGITSSESFHRPARSHSTSCLSPLRTLLSTLSQQSQWWDCVWAKMAHDTQHVNTCEMDCECSPATIHQD